VVSVEFLVLRGFQWASIRPDWLQMPFFMLFMVDQRLVWLIFASSGWICTGRGPEFYPWEIKYTGPGSSQPKDCPDWPVICFAGGQ
jgi:hypothetical protein